MLEEKLIEIVEEEFTEIDKNEVLEMLKSIKLEHVKDESDFNLLSTRFAILKLAKGSLDEVIRLTEAAKVDYRDVIYWSSLKN